MRNPAQVEVTLTNGDKTTVSQHTQQKDEFEMLLTPGAPSAEVEVGVGNTLPFGEFKVFVRVVLRCDQRKTALDAAATLAYMKADEYAKDAWNNYLIDAAARERQAAEEAGNG